MIICLQAAEVRYPERHPVNTFLERSSGFIPGDAWSDDGPMKELFASAELTAFIAESLEIPQLYCYADPLAGLTANILDPGQEFSWHFDTNDFAVTLLIDEPDGGGLFQYVPGIRSATEEGFDAIQAVLEGGALLDGQLGVRTLQLRPGDMQIFRGRYSLHRVTRVSADSTPRHAAIFAYTEQPGVIGRLARTRQLFGRALPEHIESETTRVRSDALLD
ncbi:MAG: arpA protein [Propionibacteriales bacterium]|nr:arpA protein [Propionibacteriales bacterium]